jgi:hypothetical protein
VECARPHLGSIKPGLIRGCLLSSFLATFRAEKTSNQGYDLVEKEAL